MRRVDNFVGSPADKLLQDAMFEAGSTANDDVFNNWANPGARQRAEFGQQVALQMYQNEWNSETAKMQRMMEAGINPLLAGQSIASGGNSPSVGGVPSSSIGASNPVGEVVNAANAVTSGAANIAEAAFKNATKTPTVEKLLSEAAKNLADKGLTEEEIYAWQVDNKYRDENAQVELRTKLLNEQNTAKQWEVMHAQYELMTTQLDTEIAKQKELYELAKLDISQAGLADAEKAYYGALQAKTQYDADFAKIRIDWWNAQGYDLLNSSADAILAMRIENGKSNSEIIRAWSDFYGSRKDAEEFAAAKYTYANSYNASVGANQANFDYDWNTPPKTLWEFITKAFHKGVDDSKEVIEANGDKDKNDESLSKASNKVLKESFRNYYQQLLYQYSIIAQQEGENYDENGKVIDIDKKIELDLLRNKLDKMPRTFHEYKMYVRNH